jgi:integrase/recombinase XerD
VTLGEQHCRTPEEFKAWSQNLGHEDVLITFYSYGEVQQHRQDEIFQQLKQPRTSIVSNADEFAQAVIKAMAIHQMQQPGG